MSFVFCSSAPISLIVLSLLFFRSPSVFSRLSSPVCAPIDISLSDPVVPANFMDRFNRPDSAYYGPGRWPSYILTVPDDKPVVGVSLWLRRVHRSGSSLGSLVSFGARSENVLVTVWFSDYTINSLLVLGTYDDSDYFDVTYPSIDFESWRHIYLEYQRNHLTADGVKNISNVYVDGELVMSSPYIPSSDDDESEDNTIVVALRGDERYAIDDIIGYFEPPQDIKQRYEYERLHPLDFESFCYKKNNTETVDSDNQDNNQNEDSDNNQNGVSFEYYYYYLFFLLILIPISIIVLFGVTMILYCYKKRSHNLHDGRIMGNGEDIEMGNNGNSNRVDISSSSQRHDDDGWNISYARFVSNAPFVDYITLDVNSNLVILSYDSPTPKTIKLRHQNDIIFKWFQSRPPNEVVIVFKNAEKQQRVFRLLGVPSFGNLGVRIEMNRVDEFCECVVRMRANS